MAIIVVTVVSIVVVSVVRVGWLVLRVVGSLGYMHWNKEIKRRAIVSRSNITHNYA